MCDGRGGDDRFPTLLGDLDQDRCFICLNGICDVDLCGGSSGDLDIDLEDDLFLRGDVDGDLNLRCCGGGDKESDCGLSRLKG